jgi:hypothetical protein
MAKRLLYNRASVREGTNRVVCESRFRPNYIKPGAYIKFEESAESYTIAKSEETMCILDFVCERRGVLTVEGEAAMDLTEGDQLDITYKQYEIDYGFIITSSGSGYMVGDIIEVDAGEPMLDTSVGEKMVARLKVTSINESGAVEKLHIESLGSYSEPPQEKILLNWSALGGSGEGLELNINFNTISNRGTFTKEVMDLNRNKNKFYIYLDSEMPRYIKRGKLSVKKYVLFLNSNCSSRTKFSERFSLIVDFTENYGLPFLLDNSLNLPFVFNGAMNVLDKKIKELEDEIEKLKNN